MEFIISLYSYKGKLGRLKYVISLILVFIIFLITFNVGLKADNEPGSDDFGFFSMVALLLWFWGKFCATIKRLHDLNKSGFLSFLLVIPLANLILVIYLFVTPAKKYKAKPKHTTNDKPIESKISSDNDHDLWRKYCDVANDIILEINRLKGTHLRYFKAYDYTSENAAESLPYVKQLYEQHKKLLPIAKRYNQITEFDDYYSYNLANCYVALGQFENAREVFEFSFKEIPKEGIYNLPNSFVSFIVKTVEKEFYDIAFNSYYKIKEYLSDDNLQRIENDIVEELSEYFTDLAYKNETNKIQKLREQYFHDNLIERINKKVNLKYYVYRFVTLSENEFKAKNYQKAYNYFLQAIKNSKTYDHTIYSHYELFGDILFKLKSFDKSIEAYKRNLDECNNKHRIYMKIGDGYTFLNQFNMSLRFYIMSLYKNIDYKSVQPKIVKSLNSLSINTNLDELIHFCKSNPDKIDRDFAKLLNEFLKLKSHS